MPTVIMGSRMETRTQPRTTLARITGGILILAAAALFGTWLILTPDGLMGKADAIGYSVCHRIDTHSFFIGSRQLPLCARCSGMYLGMLASLIYLLRVGRRTGFPVLKISLPLSLLFLTFGIDGLNSFAGFIPSAPTLYAPTNFLRLVTGAGLGMLVPMFLLPVFHQTLWDTTIDHPVLEKWRQVLPLIAIVFLAALGVFSEIPALLYPLALLSALTVPLILGVCYSLIWIIIFRKENTYASLKQAWMPLLAGLFTALLQIGVIDLLRYQFTGTWAGFQL